MLQADLSRVTEERSRCARRRGMSPLPQGWISTTLGQLIELNYGRSLPEKDRRPGLYTVFGSNGPVGSHEDAITGAPAIVVGRKGSIGRSISRGIAVFLSIPRTLLIALTGMSPVSSYIFSGFCH